jgi:hypothetical protein
MIRVFISGHDGQSARLIVPHAFGHETQIEFSFTDIPEEEAREVLAKVARGMENAHIPCDVTFRPVKVWRDRSGILWAESFGLCMPIELAHLLLPRSAAGPRAESISRHLLEEVFSAPIRADKEILRTPHCMEYRVGEWRVGARILMTSILVEAYHAGGGRGGARIFMPLPRYSIHPTELLRHAHSVIRELVDLACLGSLREEMLIDGIPCVFYEFWRRNGTSMHFEGSAVGDWNDVLTPVKACLAGR